MTKPVDRVDRRKTFLFSLLRLTVTFSLLLSPTLCDTNPGDAAVMQSLAKSLHPVPSGWSSSAGADPCEKSPKWDGVSCDTGRVTSINLQSSSVAGTLPQTLNKLSNLQSLSLQKNQISGDLPSFEGLANLQEIYLGSNNFQSIPPRFFSGLTSLMNFSLDDNPLQPWSIPSELSGSTNLVVFSAMNASIMGPIPDFFGSMSGLQTLKLSYNNLEGGIPPSFRSSGIIYLYLNSKNGKLSGPIDVIGSMTQLSVAWLHSNNFTGSIPDLSNCKSLVDLNLRDNALTGIVPPLASPPPLQDLTLANNYLQGPMPNSPAWTETKTGNSFCNPTPGPCDPRVTLLLSVAAGFGYPLKLAKSWMGNDPCGSNAWLFVSCDPQGNVISLNFANQMFVGSISPAIANFTSLKKINLTNNVLTGSIPESLTRLTQLQALDVSNNNLTGKVPTFGPGVMFISTGNPLLGVNTGGGGSVPSPGGSGSLSPGGSASGGSHSVKVGQIVAIVVGVIVFVIVLAGIVYYYRYRKRSVKFGKVPTHSPPNGPKMFKIDMAGLIRNGGHASELNSQSSSENGNAHLIESQSMSMSIQDLRQATDNFSEANILGSGGFGVVYRGVRFDGTLIAVKRMQCGEMGKKGMDEFMAEINVLRKVRHRNLVALLGYCMDGYERLLVYEYMPQGTLGQHLFCGNESLYSSLSWKQRLVIALDVAKGVEYLHSLAQESFIHRDLKPSNILLDNEMRAKVSDFGLVKLAPEGKNSVATRLAGTFGYLAPEYATTGKVTTKVDVYAYGVVLMELITGRKALDETLPEESSHLVTWFRRVIINKDKLRKSVDSTLNLDGETFDSIAKVAELAGHCTARDSHQRPDMGHAVNILAPLVDQWKPSGLIGEDINLSSFKESLPQQLRRWQNDEGTSMMDFNFNFNSHVGSMDNTQESIPTNPDMFPDGR